MDRARSLIAKARSSYSSIVVLTAQFERVKEQYSLARYRVNAMASAPVASSLADLPAELANTLFSSAVEAMDAIDILRETTTTLLKTIHINIEELISSSRTEASSSESLYQIKNQKRSAFEKEGGNTVVEIVKREMEAVCGDYETARQLIVSEMEDCDGLVRLALSGYKAADEDEVLFSARGELVTASRSSLLRIEGTYFYGLLNRGSWLTDAIGAHPIDDDSALLKLIIESLVDAPLFSNHVRELDICTRDYLATRLDYYQIPVSLISNIKVDDSIISHPISYNSCSLTAGNSGNTAVYRGGIWDTSIHKYSVKVEASSEMHIMVGFAPVRRFDVAKPNYTTCGWYLYLLDGCLWAQDRVRCKPYANNGAICNAGDTITCIYNASSKEISFERNGVSLGVAYSNIIGEDIAPAVEVCHNHDTITLSAL